MAFNGPVLLKRIPNDASQRKLIGYQDYVNSGGYSALKKALDMPAADVTKLVQDSGLRGRGGAGFPCGLKWTFLPKDVHPRYLAVNFDESEPSTFKDRYLCDWDPHTILEGIAIAAYATSITTSYIFIRGEYHKEAKILQAALDEAYANGIFGQKHPGTDITHQCYIHRGAGAYICGEETGLLEALEGKRGWPRIKPPFPAIAGAFAKPTLINNIETLSNLPFIVNEGVAAFKAMGTASSAGSKLMGVSGHCMKPGVFEEELGIPMSKLIEQYAGGVKGKFKSAFHGGISMGVLSPDQYHAEMDFDIGKKYGVLGLGTACVTVMNDTVDMVSVARNVVRFYTNESCGQCTPCREGSAWAFKLLSRIEGGRGKAKDLDLLLEVALSQGSMPGTTICGLADGTNWVVKTILQKFPDDFKKRIKPSGTAGVSVTVGGVAV
jgi:NADH-quinone oxidoreductase subunit F